MRESDGLFISKGRLNKKYEVGRKTSITLTKTTGVIVGAMSIDANIYDGRTMPGVFKQCWTLTEVYSPDAIYDLGCRDLKKVGDAINVHGLCGVQSQKADPQAGRTYTLLKFLLIEKGPNYRFGAIVVYARGRAFSALTP